MPPTLIEQSLSHHIMSVPGNEPWRHQPWSSHHYLTLLCLYREANLDATNLGRAITSSPYYVSTRKRTLMPPTLVEQSLSHLFMSVPGNESCRHQPWSSDHYLTLLCQYPEANLDATNLCRVITTSPYYVSTGKLTLMPPTLVEWSLPHFIMSVPGSEP